MENYLNLQQENITFEQLINNIKDDLSKIKSDYENQIINIIKIYSLYEHLNEIKLPKDNNKSDIIDLFNIEYLFFFRIILLSVKSHKLIFLKILKTCIEINPKFTNKIIDSMLPIVLCKIFEDSKNSFEERYECLKLFQTWLNLSDNNFPIIFPQAIVSLSKIEDTFKIGCIEFLREMSIRRPDICSTVGGFRILINSLIEEKLPNNLINKIIYTLIYIINTINKRKYFNGFGDFYKIFSIFTKSDFSSGVSNSIEMETRKRREEINKENKRLELQLDTAIYIIKTIFFTWPGYFLLMYDKITISSLAQSLNNDVNIIIKKAILKLFKEILEEGSNILDNFNIICSDDNDYIYINKIYLAFFLKGLFENNLNENLFKFIEDNENNELRDFATKLYIKFNILFTKLSNYNIHCPYFKEKNEDIRCFNDLSLKEELNDNKNNGINLLPFYHFSEENNENENIRIKLLNLTDKIFHHLNCRDNPQLTLESLSTEIIIAIHSILNVDMIKQYENQYSIESCKKELYSKDDESFPQTLKNSKVIELKEFQSWDWTQIDALLDLIEVKKELIPELNKQKFFKKLLFSYSPSKNLIVKQTWTVNNFYYGAIGNKLFKILISLEDLSIIDSPNEDYIFQKSNSWIKDVINCLDSLLEKNIPEDHPFTIKRIYNTLSRNIFIFIGIISNSNQGDDYLNKQGFYSLLDKFITQSNKFDYLLTIIIDNLNFNSKYTINLLHKILTNGNNQIKKYVLEHIRCLIIFGKEIIIDVKILFKALDPEYPDCNKIIVSIMKLLINKNKNIAHVVKEETILEKINQVDKSLLYILMRDPKIYEYLHDMINKEVNNINIDEIVENYGNIMNESTQETSFNKIKDKNKHYLTINLSEIKNQYNHFYEYFWIKQLPFSVVLQSIENKDKRTEYILNNYMEYNDDNNIKITSEVQDPQKIIFDESISGIQLICLIGRITISRNCNSINNASNFLTFSINDIFKEVMPYDISKKLFIFKKDHVNLILKENESKKNYTLEKIFFIIRVKPDIINGFTTPINLITELNNNKKGYEELVKINAVEKLFSYSKIKDESEIDINIKKIKSSFWILAKLILKNEFGEKIESKYNIIERISNFFFTYNDYSLKGTILYLITFIAQNKHLREKLKKYNFDYFFNTNIGYPTIKNSLCIDKSFQYENQKLENDVTIIEYGIKLNPISQEIYNNVTNLANNITSKNSLTKLDEIYRANTEYFMDANLCVKVYSALTKYKFKENSRRAIMYYFDKCITSSKIAFNCSKILKNLGEDLLNAHSLY